MSRLVPIPSRRQAGATSMVSSRPLVSANAATPTTWAPIRATTPLVVSSYSTGAGSGCCRLAVDRLRERAQGRGPRVLGGAPLLGVRPEQLLQQGRQQRGIRHHVLGGGQPSRRLVDQVVSGAGFDAHLVPACTTHELGDRTRGPGLGHTDHQLVGDRPEVGEDLQAHDVQAGLAAAAWPAERAHRGVRSARCAPGSTWGHCHRRVLRIRGADVAGVSTNAIALAAPGG